MKARWTLFLSFCFLLFGSQTLHAQTPTQVIVAGADFSLPSTYVRVSTWDISSGTLTTFDSIPGSIAKHVFIWGNDAYVCTDSILLKYDLTTLQRVAEVKILGIQRIAVYLDKVIVTKGLGIEQSSSYLEVRYDANLGLTFTVPGVTDDCRGIVVVGDTAYIANPGLFVRLRGDMAVLDLPNQTLKRIASLDTMGRQIQDMYAVGNKIYSVNIQKYNNPTVGYISEYDIATMAFFHNRIPFPMSISAGIYNDLLYAQFGNYIGTWDINLRAFDDQTLVGGIFDALTIDSVNGVLYASQTDRVTQGKIYKYDMAGLLLDSLVTNTGVTAMAIDYNVTVGNAPDIAIDNRLHAYPQPVGNLLHVDLRHLASPTLRMVLTDIQGRKVIEQTVSGNGIAELSTADLPAGVYILQVETRKELAILKVIKTQD